MIERRAMLRCCSCVKMLNEWRPLSDMIEYFRVMDICQTVYTNRYCLYALLKKCNVINVMELTKFT